MNKKVISMFINFIVIVTVIICGFYIKTDKIYNKDSIKEKNVEINEIVKLSELTYSDNNGTEKNIKDKKIYKKELNKKIVEINDEINTIANNDRGENIKKFLICLYAVTILFLIIVMLYINYTMIYPFDKLKKYAAEIAKGNFDIKLRYERKNFFGDFTWAFDHMRKEIVKARRCEKEAIENNKVVVATLSHDIKTPIASIRAYTEALEAGLDTNIERRKRYTQTIINKCDEVTNLTNDLFLHSISELEKLKVNVKECEISEIINKIVSEWKGSAKREIDINVIGDIQTSLLKIDTKRFEQVFENILTNAQKYAIKDNGAEKTAKIDIAAYIKDNKYFITIRDYGDGIADEDIPFVFYKFYRGKNAANINGSGLGLYISKYIMQQMNGDITLKDMDIGLEVKIELSI